MTVLEIADLQLMRGTRTILDGVTLTVERGEMVAVMGPSGSGKTTILRTIAGLEPFDAGRIVVDGVALSGGSAATATTRHQLHRKVGMVFQFHCLFEHLTAVANICLAPVHAYGIAAADAKRRAHDLLATFGVEHRADALPRQLSGGEAQRVAIARALAQQPELLLCDEPTGHLDSDTGERVLELIDALQDELGFSLVVATHDADVAARLHRELELEDGAVVLEERS